MGVLWVEDTEAPVSERVLTADFKTTVAGIDFQTFDNGRQLQIKIAGAWVAIDDPEHARQLRAVLKHWIEFRERAALASAEAEDAVRKAKL